MEGEASHKAHRHAKAGRKADKKKAAKNGNNGMNGPSRKDKTQNPKVSSEETLGHFFDFHVGICVCEREECE